MNEGPVSGRKIKRRTIRYIAVAVVLLIMLYGAYKGITTYFQSNLQETQQAEKAELQTAAKEVATIITKPMLEYQSILDALVSNEDLHALLANADQEKIENNLSAFSEGIPHLLKLRIFMPGQYQLDQDATPPLGYASLDLLKDAEKKSGKLKAEVHSFGKPDAHIVMVRRVESGEQLIGLIHLSIAFDPVIQSLKDITAVKIYFELTQNISGKKLVLFKKGHEDSRSGAPITQNINGTSWQISVWSSAASVAQQTFNPVDLITDYSKYLIPVVGVLILFFLIIYLRAKRAAAASLVFGGAVKAIMDGAHPGLEKLVPNLPNMGQKKSITPVSQGMEEEDATTIASADDIQKKTRAKQQAQQKVKHTIKSAKQSIKAKNLEQQALKKSESSPDENAAPDPSEAGMVADITQPPDQKTESSGVKISAEIFRAYDIRGIAGKTLSKESVYEIGKAIGSEADNAGQKKIIVGRDGRTSSPELAESLIKGLMDSGRDVIDIGMVPTPLLYFATHHLDANSGVMITGSHNGPEYNGLKIVLNGETLSGESIQGLYTRINNADFTSGQGSVESAEIIPDYLRTVTEDIPVALGGAFKIVIDCGNGVAGGLAPQLYRALGHDVVELFCEVDGKFPNHQPDPSQPENLKDLIEKISQENADIGLAFDGDGDRLGVVDGEGNIIWPDRQMILFARDVLSRNQGKAIIFDVKCSRHLKEAIENSGGNPIMWKTGHSLIKSKMKEEDAPLAGEMSGHIFFKERWFGFDDGMYAGARLIEILASKKEKPADIFASLPDSVSTPEIRVPLAEKHHGKFMQILHKKISFENANISEIDGIRVDFDDGWGLIRPSNTSPCLTVRFEAESENVLNRIKSEFRDLIISVSPDIKVPF